MGKKKKKLGRPSTALPAAQAALVRAQLKAWREGTATTVAIAHTDVDLGKLIERSGRAARRYLDGESIPAPVAVLVAAAKGCTVDALLGRSGEGGA